jgi:hypothetical protein
MFLLLLQERKHTREATTSAAAESSALSFNFKPEFLNPAAAAATADVLYCRSASALTRPPHQRLRRVLHQLLHQRLKRYESAAASGAQAH